MAKNELVENLKHSRLRVLYTVFLAIIIVLFYGLGVAAFYPAPKAPDYPNIMQKESEPIIGELNEEQVRSQEDYEVAQREYNNQAKTYGRNASMIILGLAVISLVVSLTFLNNILLISDGLLLGGVFTLVYSIIIGMSTEDAKFRFSIVTIGLLITIALGYIKFIRPQSQKK
jgi:hypothetical protein